MAIGWTPLDLHGVASANRTAAKCREHNQEKFMELRTQRNVLLKLTCSNEELDLKTGAVE